MKLEHYFKLLFAALPVLLFPVYVQAQQSGNIRGVITDDTGLYVPGATVLIDDLNKGTVTDLDGDFVFVDVSAGTHTLSVHYLGYQAITREIEVTPGKTVSMEISLTEENTELDEVVLTGYGFGSQAKALNTQKNRQNITNIISADQMGKFPDANIGDAIKRVPGITMKIDQGEARDIIIRGLAPQLNSVTLNGTRIPSAEGDNRNVQMDLIPSDMIQTVEVSKAVTPDMDADALGGSVNLVTRSAPGDFRLSATAGSGINTITDKRILNGSFLLGDRSKNQKFGWMLSASVNDNDFGSDNVEAEWSDELEYNNGDEDNLELAGVHPYASKVEVRKYLVQRIRRSISANFEYNFNADNSIYFKSMYNWRDDRENRYTSTTEILDGEDIGPADFEVDTGNNLVRFPVEGERSLKGGVDSRRGKSRRLEEQRMQNYTLGGDHLMGKIKLDWMTAYSEARERKPQERGYAFVSDPYTVENGLNTRKPVHRALTSLSATDYAFDSFGEETSEARERDINAFINAEIPADFFGYGSGTVKFGVRGRFKDKSNTLELAGYNPEFDLETMADTDLVHYNDNDFLAGKQYVPGTFTAATYLGALQFSDASLFEKEDLEGDYLGENFKVKENVVAGYIMANQKLSDKLSLLAGVRVENTWVESEGNEVVLDEEGEFAGSNTLSDKNNYVNILPGLHFRYNVNDNTVLRLAWTNTLSRPNYIDLAPYEQIVREDEEVFLGNPDLEPTTSMNFDFMGEHYFRSVGIVSGGVFYKDLKDFVYTFVTEDEATGYKRFQPLNGDKAGIFGLEAAFQRQLDFLPGFGRNLGIYLNYTYIEANAKGVTNEDGDERGDLDLPGSAPHMFNGSLSYSGKKIGARISANYSGAYLDELGGDSFEDRYYDQQFFLDFNASLTINKNLRIYADVNNITNQPLRFYQGVKNRTMQMEYYGRRITFGIKYDLF
ncbi:TonB-dependent receptor [Sinomicrobium soli]|uniref:TonB-dependent receptor n=1 Tax=Sinomicrobium sp. N-1-3-6 TaxID=2219864 RepID=UPI000DCB3AEB|nr:TonB-dependent receptor [Sinomicrobium sp. N-1-3-6]RAV29416.1 TonB-dependent receptor [Sinomicrobium sp. N-1-3-6]